MNDNADDLSPNGPNNPVGFSDRLAGWLSNAAMFTACAGVVVMMIHVSADAIGKYVFHKPMPATVESVQFIYMVALVFLPIAYIARGEGHICVELFTRSMRPRARAFLNIFTGLLTLIWVGLIAFYAGQEAVTMTIEGELQETAEGFIVTWPTRWFIPLGCAIMAFAVAIQLIHDVRAASGHSQNTTSDTQ